MSSIDLPPAERLTRESARRLKADPTFAAASGDNIPPPVERLGSGSPGWLASAADRKPVSPLRMPAKPEGLDADCIAVRSGGCSGIRLDILRISDCRRSDIDWERFEVETAVLAAESSVIALRIEASKSS